MKENDRFPFYTSLALHGIVVFLLVMQFEGLSQMPVLRNSPDAKIINATVVVESPPLKKIVPAPLPPKVLPQSKPAKIMPQMKKVIAIPDKKSKKIQKNKIAEQLLKDLKKQTARSLQEQLLAEENLLKAQRAEATRGVVDKYKALILQAISQHWLVPATVDKKLYCELLIRLAPGGSVLDVQIVKSSGDVALDRSARAAVFKASPLPTPAEKDAFEEFRQFVLRVKPENLVSQESIGN